MEDKESVKQWVEVYLPKIKMTESKQLLTKDKKFKSALKKGIPSEIRGMIWEKLIGNHLRMTD